MIHTDIYIVVYRHRTGANYRLVRKELVVGMEKRDEIVDKLTREGEEDVHWIYGWS